MATALLAGATFGIAACDGGTNNGGNGGNNGNNGNNNPPAVLADLEVVSPDGAPALSLCYAISEEDKKEDELFDFDIVNADTITTYVTGANPKADICVLPVNDAAKILGTGSVYQMLGTVTNGNLYFITTGDNAVLTAENLKTALVGKKVGVVQLPKVPGLTLQLVLSNYDIPYQTIESAQAEGDAAKVNLVAFTPENVTPAGGCDYYLCPEPAASAKIKGTATAQKPFKMAGDLQALYGEEGGYPQAAVVAKKSVIENRLNDVKTFLGYLEKSANFLENATVDEILRLLDEEREDGVTPSFSDKNLTKEVVSRCSVRFTASKDCKAKVVSFLEKLIAVNPNSTAQPADEFFYMG